MNKNGSGILVACICLAIFLVVAIFCAYLCYENRELRSIVVAQENINKDLIEVNEGLCKLNDEILETVDKLTEKLNEEESKNAGNGTE